MRSYQDETLEVFRDGIVHGTGGLQGRACPRHCKSSGSGYSTELEVFRDGLVDSRSSTPSTDFAYEIPSSSVLAFNRDDDLLASMSSRYIASSLSKFELATILHANGSEVLMTRRARGAGGGICDAPAAKC